MAYLIEIALEKVRPHFRRLASAPHKADNRLKLASRLLSRLLSTVTEPLYI